MQRAKMNWIKDVDRNTSFFHRAIVKRRRRNTIISMRDENNVLHYMRDKISNTFVNYFRSIFFASTQINNSKPYLNTQLPENAGDYTYSLPDEKEVLDTLK
jgi:hypothetical protein